MSETITDILPCKICKKLKCDCECKEEKTSFLQETNDMNHETEKKSHKLVENS